MTSATKEKSKGLAGVTAADTALSDVNGEEGKLIYRGYDIEDLGENATFEEVVYLLWNGDLPTKSQLETFKAALVAKRALPTAALAMMKLMPHEAHPMAVLRTVVSFMGTIDPTADDISLEAAQRKALTLTAVMPTIVAAWERIRNNQEPIAPRNDLGHAANFLYMLSGEEPDADAVNAVDAYLVLLADHGFNASTFASRVTTGTLSDMYSAVTTGLGTLKGAAHGGANQKAMEQFMDAAQRGDVEAWFHDARESGRRIMGIGHRVYKVEDPRQDPQAAGAPPGGKQRPEKVVRYRQRDRRVSPLRPLLHRAQFVRQRRLLFGRCPLHRRHSRGPVHLHLRHEPRRRLDGPRAGAVGRQPPHPPQGQLRRRDAPRLRAAGRTSLSDSTVHENMRTGRERLVPGFLLPIIRL